MGLQNGPGTETRIGMDIVIASMMGLQNGTGTETPKQIDEIRNQIAGNPEADIQRHGSR